MDEQQAYIQLTEKEKGELCYQNVYEVSLQVEKEHHRK